MTALIAFVWNCSYEKDGFGLHKYLESDRIQVPSFTKTMDLRTRMQRATIFFGHICVCLTSLTESIFRCQVSLSQTILSYTAILRLSTPFTIGWQEKVQLLAFNT